MAMQEGIHEFQITANESEYLKQLALQDKLLAGLLRSRESHADRGTSIRLTHGEAERLRLLDHEVSYSWF